MHTQQSLTGADSHSAITRRDWYIGVALLASAAVAVAVAVVLCSQRIELAMYRNTIAVQQGTQVDIQTTPR